MISGAFSLAKGLMFIAYFVLSGVVFYFIFLIYGFLAFGLVLLITGLFFGLIVSVIPALQPREPLALDLLLLILYVIVFFILGLFSLGAACAYFLAPIFIENNLERRKDKYTDYILSGMLQEVRRRTGIKFRATVFPADQFFIGILSIRSSAAIFIDKSLLGFLEYLEMESILAHECGHLLPGHSISYSFLRRSLFTTKMLRALLAKSDDKILFRRTIRIVTALFPPVLKEGSRYVSYHLGESFCYFHELWTRQLAHFYRRDFHEAEFAADNVAYSAYGPSYIHALITVAICQFLTFRKESNPEEVPVEDWRRFFSGSSTTHPSLALRLFAMTGKYNEETFEYIFIKTAKKLRAMKYNNEANTQDAFGLQALCLREFEIPAH